ncbi:MAG: tyrosine-type recombinase/integrase [Huintestinicola sp.]|uniref:tyrosine-type recombinase/integrase n=1 Tax=Huintestinicola sp. TaxID=2981661 RepID=UPI003EFD12BC
MPRRGENIYHRKDGRWEGRCKCGVNEKGNTKYLSVYGHSYSEVKRKLAEKKASSAENVLSCRLTFGEISVKWLEAKRNIVKDSSLSTYDIKLKKHILPVFGSVRYDKISSADIEGFIGKLTAEKFSHSYVSDIFFVVRSICLYAHNIFGVKNICEKVDAPKREGQKARRILNNAETLKLMRSLYHQNDTTSAGILLALSTGIRIGELCALTWENIDLEEKYITVSQTVQRTYDRQNRRSQLQISTPKSSSSERIIPLPDFIIPVLSKHRSDNSSYFLSGSSRMTEPRTMQYRFKSILKKSGLPAVNFHSLRHLFATRCIAAGADIKTLSELLGHSSVNITLNLYVHSSMERKIECVEQFARKLTIA